MIDEYVIAREAFDALRAHANRAPAGGFEIGGALLAEEGNRLVAYKPIRNICPEAGFYHPAEVPRTPWITVHSHPERRSTAPSDGDVEWVKSMFRPLGVYAPDVDRLTIWARDISADLGVRGIPVVVEPRPRPRRSPLRRPGRRG